MNIIEPVIKKIPGELPPPLKKSSQGYIDDLKKKQKFELLDLLDRQEKLLSNKRFISKLPDKGEKILKFKNKIIEELKHRDKVEDAAKLLSRLNIASEGKAAMNELEWTGKYNNNSNESKILVQLDSDDEDDPLKILAQPTGSGAHKKKIIQLEPEKTLIGPKDLEEIESFKMLDPLELDHVKYVIKKAENPENEKKKSFKPYKTTKTNVHDPEKEKLRENKKHKYWEISAATPPLIVHGAVKPLDLKESLQLQKEQTIKLQEIQTKHAAERLAQQIGSHKIDSIPQNVGNYRTKDEENSESSNSEGEHEYTEVYDEEDNDKRGTVVFTVDSIDS